MIVKILLRILVALSTVLLTGSIVQADTFSGTLAITAPTYNRPVDFTTDSLPCALSNVGTAVHYLTYRFALAAPASVTISMADNGATITPTDADPFLILYGPGGFDPLNGCNNAIFTNDDSTPTDLLPKMVTGTLGGGTYTVVVTTFDNIPAEPTAGPLPYVFTGFTSVPFLSPTAAPASLGGRVMTSAGSGIRNIKVSVGGGDLSQPLVTLTSAFGYFRFDGLSSGQTYVVTIESKKYFISQPFRVVNLNSDVNDLIFTAETRSP